MIDTHGAATAMCVPIHDRLLILGLGNDILTDDAIGLFVARAVRQRLADEPGIDVRESMEMGLTLLDEVVGYPALILIDSIQTGRAPPGHIHRCSLDEFRGFGATTPHFLGLADTFALARVLGLGVPEAVRVFAIEAEDVLTLGTELTPAVADAVPSAVDLVVEHARRLRSGLSQPAAVVH